MDYITFPVVRGGFGITPAYIITTTTEESPAERLKKRNGGEEEVPED